MAKERILQRNILRDLDSFGKNCVAFKIRSSSVDGTPDIFFSHVKCGPVFIEAKDEFEGVVSDAQREMIKNLNECGCKAFFIKSWSEWVALKKELFFSSF